MMTEMSVMRSKHEDADDEATSLLSSTTSTTNHTTTSMTFADDSLFAGLSFPQVPITIPTRAQPIDVNSLPSAPTHVPTSTSSINAPSAPPVHVATVNPYEVDTVTESTSLLDHPLIPSSTVTANSENVQQQQRKKAANLTSLYATTEVSLRLLFGGFVKYSRKHESK